jgi:dTDP-4-amino-4,6-dideoxygalactose transaminase
MGHSKVVFGDLSRRQSQDDDLLLSVLERVLASGKYLLGDFLRDFEREFKELLEIVDGYVLGVSNGSDAIRIALEAKKILNKQQTGKVALAANTYYAAAASIVHSGLTPTFFDVSLETRFPNSATLNHVNSSNIIGVVKSHLYGGADTLNYGDFFPQAWTLEDASQAHGTTLHKGFVGSSNLTTYSFYPTKNLGAIGDAGAIVTFNESEYEVIKKLRNQGVNEERTDHELIGFNARLSELQAGFLVVKMIRFKEKLQRRIQIFERYQQNLGGHEEFLHFFTYPESVFSSHHLVQVLIKNQLAQTVQKNLETKEIFCGRHYPKPLHLQKAFRFLGYREGDFPNSEKLSNQCLSLPNHPELTNAEVDYVSEALIETITQVSE